MGEQCCESPASGGGGNIMILACSGGSNVGQISNKVAIELTQEGFGKMYCLAGIGGGLSGFVRSAKDAPALLVMDGCEIACAKATLEKAGIPCETYLIITKDLDIEKNKDFNLKREDVEKVKEAVKNICRRKGFQSSSGANTSCCC